jgi:excisionase family DNA binding protein
MHDSVTGGPVSDAEAPMFLTAQQVAELLQVSEKSVLRWAAQDPSMPALRIGRTLRFPREQLLAWFKTNTQGFGRPRTHKGTHRDLKEHVTV